VPTVGNESPEGTGSLSTHVGVVGERQELSVKLLAEPMFLERGDWPSYLYRFEDADGNQLVWFSSKKVPMVVGVVHRIRATVKRHGRYQDVPQTMLSRVKCLEFQQDFTKIDTRSFEERLMAAGPSV